MSRIKILVKAPMSVYSGYGNDGIGIIRTLVDMGADVYIHPSIAEPPLPQDIANLFTKKLVAPFDLTIHHVDPGLLEATRETRAASDLLVAWSMWEYSSFNNLKQKRTLRSRLKPYDVLLGYDQVSADCYKPYMRKPTKKLPAQAVGVLQGGFQPGRWPTVERDWFSERFGFVMLGQLHAQPLDAKVLTPEGWKTMGDISVGDIVCDPSGGDQKVEEISPRSMAQVYRVTFKDGSSTRCTGDHLWRVKQKNWRNNFEGSDWQVLRTEDMLAAGLTNSSKNFKFKVPAPTVDFAPSGDLPLDPYLLGVILGDGNSSDTSMTITTVDDCLLREVEAVLPRGVSLKKKDDGKTVRLLGQVAGAREPGVRNIIKKALDSLGLCGVKTPDKFVPDAYLHASAQDRIALLQGLLDSDGWTRRIDAGFASASPALVAAVVFLVRSLGGSASVSAPKRKSYLYDGERRHGMPSQEVRISTSFNPFRMERKSAKWSAGTKDSILAKTIISIEPDGTEEVQCIAVSGDTSTYITDDFVVTHNSRKDPFVAIQAFQELKEEFPDFAPAELHLKTNVAGLHPMMEEVIPGLKIHYATWSEDAVKDFYAANHVLLAPSRGEGKNMPALEFQSTGGPVIATNWGGHTQWLNSEYSYPLDYVLRPVSGEFGESCMNARASKDHLKQLMLHTFRNRAEVKRKGELAAQVIPAQCSWESVIDRLFRRLAELSPEKGERIFNKAVMTRSAGADTNG